MEFRMFTNAGDAAIYGVVATAEANDLTWPEVFQSLRRLAKQKGFEEATDTEVRRAVYEACGFKTEFYI